MEKNIILCLFDSHIRYFRKELIRKKQSTLFKRKKRIDCESIIEDWKFLVENFKISKWSV